MLAALIAFLVQAPSPEISSVYTEIDTCMETPGPAPINERCVGYAGWVIHIGASEHSAGLAYSDRARDEQLSQRPITTGLYQGFDRTIEWRVRRADDDWIAFATIHRWTSRTPVFDAETGAQAGETDIDAHLLVVSVLREDGPIGACHAAYIDVREVYDANTVARRFTDLMADRFRCGIDDPYRIGAGEAAMLMERGRL